MIRKGAIRIPFRYAAGRTGSRFLVSLRDEKTILGSRCAACEQVACPALPFCPGCSASTETVEVSSEGSLVSWTVVPERGAYGLVKLDGADTPMLHRLVGPPAGWAIGLRVRARFREERTASVLDIEGFEALEDER